MADSAYCLELALSEWSSEEVDAAARAAAEGGKPLELCAADLEATTVALLTPERFPSIVLLDLSENPLESLAGLEALATLRHLHLRDVRITKELTSGAPCPTVLALNLCGATVDGLSEDEEDDDKPDTATIAAKFPRLQALDLSHCDITDQHIAAAASTLPPSLVELSLEGNEGVAGDEDSLQRLAAHLPALRSLNIKGTSLLESSSISAVRAIVTDLWPSLTILDGTPVAEATSKALRKPSTSATGHTDPSGAEGVAFRDASSCSCLEGEPCVDPENCKDWANRFKITALCSR